MTNLFLSYAVLFVTAALIGFAGGWVLRALTTREQRSDVEEEIASLSHALAQARQQAGLDG